MKVIIRTKYGSADTFQLKEVPQPTPKADEVLIKVQAVSLNASDCESMRGKPIYQDVGTFQTKKTRFWVPTLWDAL
jgi:NADPH:quinone reductase-like Zn-dependent oxidoreductase